MTPKPNQLPEIYRDIPLKPGFTAILKVVKGWSRELKYRVCYEKGDALLRVRPGGDLKEHRKEFDFIRELHLLGLSVPEPYRVGHSRFSGATYMLLEWMPLDDLSLVLSDMDEKAQYDLGLQAGKLLFSIHSSPLLKGVLPEDPVEKYRSKLRKVTEAGIRAEGTEDTLRFAQTHLSWLKEGKIVNLHGDFHPGNLVLDAHGRISAIDFNRFGVGERAEEFYKLQSFTIEHSVPFAVGQLDGYFGGEPETSFWQALAVHVAASSLYSIRWAKPFGEAEVQGMVERFQRALLDYDRFSRLVPAWYSGYHREKG